MQLLIRFKKSRKLYRLSLIFFLLFLSGQLIGVKKTHAAVGDFYIARAPSTGLISNNSLATEQTLTYNTEVHTSPDIVRQPGNQAFRIQNSGRYLIIVNTRWNYADIGNNNRHVVRTLIKVGGTGLPNVYGKVSGYGRDAGSADEDGSVVVAYIRHTVSGDSSDDITIHVQNYGDTSVALADQFANESGIQIIRLPDNAAFLRVRRTTDISLSGTMDYSTGDPIWNEFGWEYQNNESDSSVIEWVSGNDITLKKAGHYLVIYAVRADTTGTQRNGATYRLRLNDSEIPASRVVSYMRGSDGARESWVQWAGIINASSNSILNIDWGSASEANNTASIKSAAMTVVKMPDTASYIRVHHNANRAGETTGAYPMAAEDEDDANVHSISSNTSRINGNSDNHSWLLFGSWWVRNTTADGTRTTEHFRWSRTGTIQPYGSGLSYTRGDQSTRGVPAGGRNVAIIADALGSSEYVEMNLRLESGIGNQHRDFIVDRVGITGVALDTLVSSGNLAVDIVDSSGSSVSSPSVTFSSTTFDWSGQQTTGTLGTGSERIRVTNTTSTENWSLSLSATNGASALWDNGSHTYDFNDTAANGRLEVDPSSSTISPQSGCSTTGLSRGSAAYFDSGNNITLLTADGTADTNCYWDITNIGLTQDIPAGQEAGSSPYTINMTLTIS